VREEQSRLVVETLYIGATPFSWNLILVGRLLSLPLLNRMLSSLRLWQKRRNEGAAYESVVAMLVIGFLAALAWFLVGER
jgi:hypothetical protein